MILDRLPSFTSFSNFRIKFDMDLQNKFDSIFQVIEEFSKVMQSTCFGNNSGSTVVDIFTMASKIESLFVTMEKNNLVTIFSEKFEQFCKMKGKFPAFEFGFLKTACDHVLTKYLTNPDLSDTIVTNAVNQYLLHCSGDRLKQVTSHIIETRRAFVELSGFVERNCDPIDVEARIIFDHFCLNFNSDERDSKVLENNLKDVLSDTNEGLNHQILVRILNLKDETAIQVSAKRFIVSFIISSQWILKHKIFCIYLLESPCDKLSYIFNQHPIVLDSVFEAISNSLIQHQCGYCGENTIWTCSDASLLSYSEIIGMFRTLSRINSKFDQSVRSFIESRKSGNLFKLIEKIESEVFSESS